MQRVIILTWVARIIGLIVGTYFGHKMWKAKQNKEKKDVE